MRLRTWVTTAALALAVIACTKKKTAEEAIGDEFVDRYLHADQDGALPLTALTAEGQLKKEQADVKEARTEGGAPEPHASWKRIGEETRDKRVVLRYDVKLDDKDDATRALRVEIADLGQGPKVVLYELR